MMLNGRLLENNNYLDYRIIKIMDFVTYRINLSFAVLPMFIFTKILILKLKKESILSIYFS